MRPSPLSRLALPFAALLLAAPGCDSAEEELPDEARVADDADADADAEGHPGGMHHGKHHGKARMLERVCSALECTDAQREELAALMPHRGKHRDGNKADKEAHRAEKQKLHAQLADAFRQDTLDTDVLSDLAAKMEARHAERRTDKVQALVKGHAILTPEQRAKAVDLVDMFADKMGKRHGKRGNKPDGEDRIAKMTSRLCDALACTDGQPEQIEAALKGAMPTISDADKQAAKAKIVAALQADSLTEADATAIVDHFDAMRHAHKPKVMDLISELHTILTADQRETVAQLIETRGLRAITGGKHGRKHGRKHGKHRRGRKRGKGSKDELQGNAPEFG